MPITEKRGDATVVCSPLTIFSYDWILHPSHASAYMDEVVEAPSNLNTIKIKESTDIFVPYNESGNIIDYIKEQSRNFKIIAESFEMETENMILGENGLLYSKQSSGDTIVIRPEDAIEKELNLYHKNTFKNLF